MQIITWNVRGVGTSFGMLLQLINTYNPDCVLLQETKKSIERTGIVLELSSLNYQVVEHPLSGNVAMLLKRKPLRIIKHFQSHILDTERRVIAAEYTEFFLINAYFPFNSDSKKKKFLDSLISILEKLSKTKDVIIGGDFNIIAKETGIRSGRTSGRTDFEREFLSSLESLNIKDSYRGTNSEIQENFYTRLDYIFLSEELHKNIIESTFLTDFTTSDHFPYSIILD